MIKKIDIQISNYCNRSCKWCPPYNMNHCNNKFMENDEFISVINKIKENHGFIDCDFKISLSRYNEPLIFYDKFIDYSSKIREVFPNSYMTLHSNGDLLTNDMSNEITSIYNLFVVNRYDTENEILAIEEIYNKFNFEHIKGLIHDINLSRYTFYYNDCIIEYNYNRKKSLNIRNRGGILILENNFIRNSKCDIIGNILEIDVDGEVYPCCETVGMNKFHKCMKIGNIFYDDFFSIYDKLQKKKEEHHICSKCSASMKVIGL